MSSFSNETSGKSKKTTTPAVVNLLTVMHLPGADSEATLGNHHIGEIGGGVSVTMDAWEEANKYEKQ